MPTSRNWIFVYNNPTTSEFISSWRQIKFLACSLEFGAERGTPHYQGYLELKTSRTKNQVLAMFENGIEPHVEMRKKTKQKALKYALKTYEEELKNSTTCVNGATWQAFVASLPVHGWTPYELPVLIIHGFDGTCQDLWKICKDKRTVKERLEKVKEKIQNGASNLEVADDDFELWVKYHRAFSTYALICHQPRSEKTKLTVVQGPTGSGKSYWAQEQDPNAYWKNRGDWWDGYQGQTTVVIDEFYGWLPFDFLLRLADRYPMQVEVKGGMVQFTSEHIIITTNKHPASWYQNVYFPALTRRVERWIVKGGRNHFQEWENFEDATFFEI